MITRKLDFSWLCPYAALLVAADAYVGIVLVLLACLCIGLFCSGVYAAVDLLSLGVNPLIFECFGCKRRCQVDSCGLVT
jgi:hypothetical protein